MIAMSNETNPSFKGSLKAQEFIQLRGHNVDAAPNLNDCFLKIWLPAVVKGCRMPARSGAPPQSR